MPRSLWLLFAFILFATVTGCSDDDEYGSILPPPTNNEISSTWRGTYVGTCMMTAFGSPYEARDIELRVSDLGDNTVRVRAYLTPDFIQSEGGQMEGEVATTTNLLIHRLVEDSWYVCNMAKAGRVISGSMNSYQMGHEGDPEWVINNIQVLREE